MPWISQTDHLIMGEAIFILIFSILPLLIASPAVATEDQFSDTGTSSNANVKLTVVYDNNRLRPGMETDWGFGCVVQAGNQRLLFDTGGDGELLLRNMKRMQIAPDSIDAVMISHVHQDHLGGLEKFLQMYSDLPVYIPELFPEHVSRLIIASGATPVRVAGPIDILPQVMSLGVISNGIDEQVAAIRTAEGWILLTGCAHPGIVNILSQGLDLLQTDQIYLTLGGFHLRNLSESRIRKIAEDMQQLGLQRIAPCHCSGLTARKVFREKYGKDFIKLGVGGVININTNTNGGD